MARKRDTSSAGEADRHSTFWQAGLVLSRARCAVLRIPEPDDPRTGGRMDALDAVVFAASSCEAFLNELPEWLRIVAKTSAGSDAARSKRLEEVGRVVEELEGEHASARLKFNVAKLLLCSAGYDRGKAPFQDFATLFKIRDAVVHMKLDQFVSNAGDRVEVPGFIRSLESKNVLAHPMKLKSGTRMPVSWTHMIATRACALWAYNAACAMVRSVADLVPPENPWEDPFEVFRNQMT